MRFLFRSNKNDSALAKQRDAFIKAMSLNHVLLWFEPDGTIADVNDHFCALFEYERDEIIGQDRRVLLPSGAAAQEKKPTSLETETPHAAEVERVTKSGKRIWMSATYLPLIDDAGEVFKVVVVSHDITRQKLEKSTSDENLLRQIKAITATHARFVYDVSGTILEVNDKALEMLGYAREELVGQKHAVLVHPDFAETDEYGDFLEDVRRGNICAGNFKRFRKDGKGIWVQAIFCPEMDVNGNVVRLISLKSDVNAIMEANDMTNTISKIQAVIEFSADGTIRHANDLFLNAMGYQLDEIVGKHHRIFMFEEDVVKSEYAEHWNILQSGKFHTGEYRRKAKDGSEVWIAASYTPVIGPKGVTVKVVKYATDITPRIKAISALREGMARLADGELYHEIQQEFDDQYGPLKQDFNVASAKLNASMRAVLASTGEISANTSEISNASSDLSRRTERQAASLEETAASITEITESLKSSALTANKTKKLVDQTQASALAGTSVVGKAHLAMEAISHSSAEISKITTLIDDISFQTNLLALNAGVEAARAGEAGRGFAVVASEVRALAQRSSEAATQISQLISTSTEQVQQGVDLVSKTGASLSEIESFVQDLTTMVEHLAVGANEQSEGLNEINVSVGSLDDVTQKNAAMFEETNAATQMLVTEVDKLNRITGMFTTEPGASQHSADSRPVATRLAS